MYKETYAALKPQFGHWVIFDHCLPFDVTPRVRRGDAVSAIRASGRRERDKEMWQALEG